MFVLILLDSIIAFIYIIVIKILTDNLIKLFTLEIHSKTLNTFISLRSNHIIKFKNLEILRETLIS